MEQNRATNPMAMPEPREMHYSGVRQAEDEIKWTDEEAKRFFTDGDGRVRSVVFENPDTGERRFW